MATHRKLEMVTKRKGTKPTRMGEENLEKLRPFLFTSSQSAVGETMANFPTLFIVALLLFRALTCAARPEPAFLGKTAQHRPVVVEVDDSAAAAAAAAEEEEESCQGIGEEECLMRRTLAAQVDYIYTCDPEAEAAKNTHTHTDVSPPPCSGD
ncbi:putative phytosulfokines 4 [Diospyros lotus]|uniref:putative phytosulfokines 4 n=1 Tax=Diospyros lotus TaxID=55363 RepID=UPI002252B0F6|nr:putative phytosulfokines 4 [Diospyros lotus]